ncbi:interleukin-19 isoform X1 [Sigmodon hispidus]
MALLEPEGLQSLMRLAADKARPSTQGFPVCAFRHKSKQPFLKGRGHREIDSIEVGGIGSGEADNGLQSSLQDMKAQCISHWLLGMALILCSVHARSLKRCLISVDTHLIEKSFQEIKRALQTKDTFQNVTILSTLKNLKSIKPVDVCCVTGHLLTFYRDRVFKDHQETRPEVVRRISSIANCFLYMQRTLEQCWCDKVHSQCHCSQEATNATRTIHDNYNQLEVSSAALKSLGELDIFLAWIDENQETPAV